MTVFTHPDFKQHEDVFFINDPKIGLRAIIAIHNTTRGPALGGTRCWPYETPDDALTDVLRLSRGMSYKSALANVPYGGGKGVIITDPTRGTSPALFLAYAKHVHRLGGAFITGEDVGTTVTDVNLMSTITPYVRGSTNGIGDPAPFTAHGVMCGMIAAVEHALNRRDLAGLTVSIQGAGSVGTALAKELVAAGAHVIIADIDSKRTSSLKESLGVTIVSTDEIYDMESDVFSPCALGATINEETISRIKAKIIAGSANNQLATPAIGKLLQERKVLYAPDYAINAGGLIAIVNEEKNTSTSDIMKEIENINNTLSVIFEASSRTGMPTYEVADNLAEKKIFS